MRNKKHRIKNALKRMSTPELERYRSKWVNKVASMACEARVGMRYPTLKYRLAERRVRLADKELLRRINKGEG